jgi:hypothetical protein
MNQATTLTIKPISFWALLSALLLSLTALILLATPALAATAPTSVPAVGIVYEGKSVPGAALGATHYQVVRSYGDPVHCNDLPTARTYTCTFKVEGGGSVEVTFNRSQISPTPGRYDTVSFIRWSQEVSGWKTTAGINTKIALQNPKAVVEAYPKATVKYNTLGQIIQVRDGRLGIQVDWSGTSSYQVVSMAIFRPIQITLRDN